MAMSKKSATNSSCEALNEHVDFVAGSVAASLSVVPNLLLLLTFSLARKKDKASPMGVVHFSFLALLDISYGVLDTISDFPFKKVLSDDTFFDCATFGAFELSLEMIIMALLVVNRYFTAYMTFKRLLCVSTMAIGIRFIRLKEKNHVRDSFLFGIVVPLFVLIVILVVSVLSNREEDADIRMDKIWIFVTFGLSACTIVVTVVSAGLISYRRRHTRVSTRSDAETELLVIFVACAFTVCHIPFFVLFGECLSAPHDPINEGMTQLTGNVHDIAFSLNSASNFFICVSTSTAFRRTFRQLALLGREDGDHPLTTNFMNQSTHPGGHHRPSAVIVGEGLEKGQDGELMDDLRR